MTKDNRDNKEKEHHHNPLQDHELEKDEVHEVLEFFRRNGMSIAIAVAIGVVASLGVIFYRNSQRQKKEYADRALATADSSEALMAISKEYKGTPAAPVALLELASQRFKQGEYSEARDTYADFKSRYPQHEMASATEVCIALCLEANGEPDEAIAAVEEFLDRNPDHFMAPVATFAKARSYEQKNELEKARAVYEDFIAANPKGGWSRDAESALRYVKQKIRAEGIASKRSS